MFLCLGRKVFITFTVISLSICTLVSVASAQARGALTPEPERVLIAVAIPGHPIGVPRILVQQLKKDLGDDEFLPKTIDLLAQQLTVEKLSLVDPRSAASGRRFPGDAEFYWLSGPAAFCGSGGCFSQLYWASPSTTASGRLFPTTKDEDGVAFDVSSYVLPRSANGLFDVSLAEATRRPVRNSTQSPDTTLTFDGQRYIIQSKKEAVTQQHPDFLTRP